MIEINNLKFSYNNTPPFLLEIDKLNIDKKSYVSIIGENGSGKSTLMLIILSLINLKLGTIKIQTNKIGYVSQKVEEFNTQFPITVRELLKCHSKVMKINSEKNIDEALFAVSMLSFKDNLIGNLSGGQQQRVFIAKALIGNPELLILDEPSTGVDLGSQKEIYRILSHLNMFHNVTILAVEHNLNWALKYSTHICIVEDHSAKLYTIEEYKKLKEGTINV